MRNIVVLAPHPDDEILGCTSVLKNHAESNLWVILVTNGDCFGKVSSEIRMKESQQALSLLNIPKDNIIVLGFGDTGMNLKESFLYRLFYSDPNTVIKSNVSAHTYHPIDGEQEWYYQKMHKHAQYTRHDFLHSLITVLEYCKPDEIYVSSQYDKHGDHRALYWFLLETLAQLNLSVIIKQYIIHGGNDKRWPKRNKDDFSKPPCCNDKLWHNRIISNEFDPEEKYKLINIFQSQITTSGYLLSFAKRTEFFLQEQSENSILRTPWISWKRIKNFYSKAPFIVYLALCSKAQRLCSLY